MGTVKVIPVNEPVLPVVVVPLRVIGAPLKVAVIVLLPPNPVPVTATDEPTLPFVGVRIMFGITVKVAVAVFELESVPVTV